MFQRNPPLPYEQKVWLSWQVDVGEVSVQLSQRPEPPPTTRMDKVAPGPFSPPSPPRSSSPKLEHPGGVNSRPALLGLSGRGQTSATDGGEGDRSGTTVVLRLVVSGARVRVGTRTQKGFVLKGLVHAVEASGVGGVTCLSINPGVLWGRESGGGGDSAGRSLDGGKGAKSIVAYRL